MKVTAIYIKSLKVDNVKTFGDNVELKFIKQDGSLPQWTLILGDNGIGKSTLLQCVAWMKPNLQDNSGRGENLKKGDIEPIINDEENEALVRLVRKDIDYRKRHTSIHGTFIANRVLNSVKPKKKDPSCVCSMEIYLTKDGSLDDVKNKFDTDAEDIFLKNEIPIFCYSASRVLGRTNINDPNLEDTIPAFLTDETTLYDAEEILHTINYAALGAKAAEKKKYDNYINTVKHMLVSILPDIDTITDIEISAPKLIENQIRQGEVTVTTKHGKKIPFNNFSLGYKTVMSWVVDLSWRLFNKYSNSAKPLTEPAIAIVDEIDLHLHPFWQRQIIDNLSRHFPNVQFIATAHSPLMVQAALNENYAVLKFGSNGVEVINEPEGVDGWRVDQILTSEFFGLKTARGLEYEELINEREELVKKKQTKQLKDKIEQLNNKLFNFHTGESPHEIENRKLISEVVEKIRAQKLKIDI